MVDNIGENSQSPWPTGSGAMAAALKRSLSHTDQNLAAEAIHPGCHAAPPSRPTPKKHTRPLAQRQAASFRWVCPTFVKRRDGGC